MKNENGISLIELSIVLAAVLIIASVSIARIHIFNNVLAKAEVSKMHAFFIYLQQKAIAQRQEQIVTVNHLMSEFGTDQYKQRLSSFVQIGVLPTLHGPPAQPTALIKQPITFANNRIIFYTSGAISPGSIYLLDKTKTYQYALTCPVAANSYIHMYRYDHGWKLLV